MADTLVELVAKISADSSELKRALADADSSINKTGGTISKQTASWQSQFTAVGKSMAVMGAAITAAFGFSTKAAVDFEDAFAGVRKTVDASDEQFTILSQGIRDLTKELPLTSTEIAGIAEAAGQLGIKTESILGFSEVMAQLGMTTNLASQDAAVALARFANITQMSQDEFGRLGAVIVDLGNNFATTEAEIVDMAMRLAGAGNTVGMTEPQIMAISAALSSVGINAELGGTAFARVMLEMNSAVASGGESLEAWAKVAGTSTEDFAKSFKDDAANAVMTLIAGVGKLQDEGADVTGVLEKLGLGGIRITDALLRAAGAGDLFTDAQKLANKAWGENTALTNEASKRLETAASRMSILKNIISDLGITIGDFFIPLLKSIVDSVMPIIDNIQVWINENPELAKTIGTIVAVVGGLMLVLGPLMMMLPGLATLFTALSGPIGLIVLAITALIAIGTLLVMNWETIKSKTIEIWDNITGFFKKTWATIVGFFKDNWDKILAILFPAVGLPILIARNWGVITDIVSDIWDNVVNGIKSAWDNVVNFVLSGVNWLIDRVNDVINLINSIPFVNIGEVSHVGNSEPIKGYASGGVVSGAIGQPQLAIVHGGETVIPANESMGNIQVNFTEPVFFDREDTMNRFVDKIRKGIQRQDRLRFGGAYSGG
jgi:TP901 family phage tail tape measure protein